MLQRICANKTAGDQKDGDIESEIADVKNSQEELRLTLERLSLQVLKNWANDDKSDICPDGRWKNKTKSTVATRGWWTMQ